MRTRQKRPKTAVDQCFSILLCNTRDLERQLFELNKLRYQVWQAELSARNRARSHFQNPPAKPPPAACRAGGYPLISTRSHPTIGIAMMTAVEAGLISVLGDGRTAGLARALVPIGASVRDNEEQRTK